MVNHQNPILSAYAASKVFSRADSEVRTELVRSLLSSESDYARKIGLYFAYRYEIGIDPSQVQQHLEDLMPSEWLGEKESFHKSIRELFHMNLMRDFPIEKYFGETKQVNQTLRDIRLNLEQGIDDFMQASKNLVNVFFEHRRRALDTTQENSGERFPDDNELTSLLNCMVSDYNGIISNSQKEALWHRFYTHAPQRRRQPAEKSKIVKRA